MHKMTVIQPRNLLGIAEQLEEPLDETQTQTDKEAR